MRPSRDRKPHAGPVSIDPVIQGLPGRITPLAAWEATPRADPPRPKPDRPVYRAPAPVRRPRPTPPANLAADTRIRTVSTSGTISLDNIIYKIDVSHAFQQVLAITDEDQIIVTYFDGQVLVEHTRPAPSVPIRRQRSTAGTTPQKP